MKDIEFVKSIEESLKKEETVYAGVTVETSQGAPASLCSKIVVDKRGPVWGTLGGGPAEFDAVLTCRKKIEARDSLPEQCRYELEKGKEWGMVCSGYEVFVLFPVMKNRLEEVKNTRIMLERGENVNLSVNSSGDFQLNGQLDEYGWRKEGPRWAYGEKLGYRDYLYIIGGGHVSKALSNVAETLDFYVTVYDNRSNLKTFVENNHCHEKKIIHYEQVGDYIPEKENVYAVIMTFAHLSDEEVLERLLRKKLKYLGMMASMEKRDLIFRNLIKKGFSPEELKRVSSPVGLPINSHTPAEIAVSVSAEMISIKNRR